MFFTFHKKEQSRLSALYIHGAHSFLRVCGRFTAESKRTNFQSDFVQCVSPDLYKMRLMQYTQVQYKIRALPALSRSSFLTIVYIAIEYHESCSPLEKCSAVIPAIIYLSRTTLFSARGFVFRGERVASASVARTFGPADSRIHYLEVFPLPKISQQRFDCVRLC